MLIIHIVLILIVVPFEDVVRVEEDVSRQSLVQNVWLRSQCRFLRLFRFLGEKELDEVVVWHLLPIKRHDNPIGQAHLAWEHLGHVFASLCLVCDTVLEHFFDEIC